MVSVNGLLTEIPHAIKLPVRPAEGRCKPLAELARSGLVFVGNAVAAAEERGRGGGLRQGQPGQDQLCLVHARARLSHTHGPGAEQGWPASDMVHVRLQGLAAGAART
ncbi:MAG: hypothetical protein MZV65_13880 [Chromatiales bacterium]|nr:hypothetical protein [Chromatiales bacterium]